MTRTLAILLFVAWLLVGLNLHGSQLELRSNVPAELMDSASLTNPDWQSVGCGTQWQVGTGGAQHYFKLRLTNTVMRLSWNRSSNPAVVGYDIFCGNAPYAFTEVHHYGNVTNCAFTTDAQPIKFVALCTVDAFGDSSDFATNCVSVAEPVLQMN